MKIEAVLIKNDRRLHQTFTKSQPGRAWTNKGQVKASQKTNYYQNLN